MRANKILSIGLLLAVLLLMMGTASAPGTVEDGFTVYYEVTQTQTLSSGQTITVPAGADRIVVYINGTIPESIAYEDV
jgi:ABC-type Fe3+-hydroxamate transport system substrate-binding protein